MHRLSRMLLAPLCAASMTGCADSLGITHPGLSPVPTVSSAGCGDGSVPCFSSTDDVPDWFFPKIYSVSPVVYWEGATSVSSSRMQYFGNCVKQDLSIAIIGPTETSRTAPFEDCGFWPESRWHATQGVPLAAGGTCGHTANLASTHTAITKIFIEWQGFTSTQTGVSSGDVAQQPQCSCDSGDGPPKGGEVPMSISAGGEMVTSTTSCTGGGGGGGGGTTTLTCYTMTVDHYWYYPDTDTYEYRFSETSTWCEESSA